MAKIWQISDGRSYVVNGDPGTTITYTNSTSNGTAAGKQAASIPAGATSVTFPSNGAEVEISSDTATIDQVFNAAAAGSGSSSGGSGSAGGVTFQVVDTLPSQGAAGVIYLVKVSETGDDKFEEWIWVDSAWESIGTTAVDPTTYAKLVGGNTFEGNQVINGDLTVTGDVSGVTESTYNVVETSETTITPTGGTWVRYTGSETALTIEEPGWDGEAEISYLETATPVDLQGVTWNPAKPILTGNGPFVYTLVHAGDGQMLAGAYGYSVATAEAIQAVAPIAWGEYTTAPTIGDEYAVAFGSGAKTGMRGTAIGRGANAPSFGTAVGYASSSSVDSVALGLSALATGVGGQAVGKQARAGAYSVAVGHIASTEKQAAIVIGCKYSETVDGQNVTHTCTTEGTGSITIGAGANTLNNGDVESSNSITIGCKASNSGADSVVIGAQASGAGSGNCAIGVKAETGNVNSVALGKGAKAKGLGAIGIGAAEATVHSSIAIGNGAITTGVHGVALGRNAKAAAHYAVAIGGGAICSDLGATVIRSSSGDGTYTQLYFSGANTPLANTYHGGAPMLGYVTKDSAGNIVAAGTRSLIDLLTDNSTFQPASLDENGEWVMPKVFHPSDLDLPVEEPTEPEEYTPLPVYPIVEPEIPTE